MTDVNGSFVDNGRLRYIAHSLPVHYWLVVSRRALFAVYKGVDIPSSFTKTLLSDSQAPLHPQNQKQQHTNDLLTMKLTTFILSTILAVTGFLDTTAAGFTCYNSGLMGLSAHMYYHSKRACQGYDGKRGKFQGTFKPGEHRKVCVNTGATKLIMEVKNLHKTKSFDLKDSDCRKEFDNLTYKCTSVWIGFGGRGDKSGWYFRYG